MPFSTVQCVFIVEHYFLWAHLKGQVHKSNPQTLAQQKDNEMEIVKISGATLYRVFTNMIEWVELCRI
jgi:hypothetical protein